MQKIFKVKTYAGTEEDIKQLRSVLGFHGFGNTKTYQDKINDINTLVFEVVCTKRDLKKVTNLVIDVHKFDFPYLEVKELSKEEQKDWFV